MLEYILLSLLHFQLSRHDNSVRLRSHTCGEKPGVLYVDILCVDILCADILYVDILCVDILCVDILCVDILYVDILCVDILYVDILCADILCVDILCADILCADILYLDILCVDILYVDILYLDILCVCPVCTFDTSLAMSQCNIQQNITKYRCVHCHPLSVILRVITATHCYKTKLATLLLCVSLLIILAGRWDDNQPF